MFSGLPTTDMLKIANAQEVADMEAAQVERFIVHLRSCRWPNFTVHMWRMSCSIRAPRFMGFDIILWTNIRVSCGCTSVNKDFIKRIASTLVSGPPGSYYLLFEGTFREMASPIKLFHVCERLRMLGSAFMIIFASPAVLICSHHFRATHLIGK